MYKHRKTSSDIHVCMHAHVVQTMKAPCNLVSHLSVSSRASISGWRHLSRLLTIFYIHEEIEVSQMRKCIHAYTGTVARKVHTNHILIISMQHKESTESIESHISSKNCQQPGR